MRVEVYFDVLCPWCYIGKRRLTHSLADREGVEMIWRSMELDPEGSAVAGVTAAEVIARYRSSPEEAAARVNHIQAAGVAEGLALDLHNARPVNSFDAHRLVHRGGTYRLADEVVETLLHAYHTRALNIADADVLEALGTEAGLDAADVRRMLDGDAFAEEVRADERSALRRGIGHVPTVVVDGGRPFSAVQDPAVLTRLLTGASGSQSGSGPAVSAGID